MDESGDFKPFRPLSTKEVLVHFEFELLSSPNVLVAPALLIIIVIIMYIYHALIDTLSSHMIHINQNTIYCTHVEQSPTDAIYV